MQEKPLVLDESSGTNVLDSYSSTEYAACKPDLDAFPLGSVLHPTDEVDSRHHMRRVCYANGKGSIFL